MAVPLVLGIIVMILGVIILVRHALELRDRPGLFIFAVLCIIAALVFFILVIVTPQEPNLNPLNGGTPVLP